jgi:hypothetical protein
MVYLYDACDQISDFCHQQLLRKMQQKISWTDGRTDRRTEVKQYTPSPSRSGCSILNKIFYLNKYFFMVFTQILILTSMFNQYQINDNKQQNI